jgi:hypothetical protein
VSLERVRLISLPTVVREEGLLTIVEGNQHVPFEIQRVYYLHGVPAGAMRGAHAHKELEQVFIAVGGEFDVLLDDGVSRRSYHLSRPEVGLYVPPMTWRTLDRFTAGAFCLVLASAHYDEADYYRTYDAFAAAVNQGAR